MKTTLLVILISYAAQAFCGAVILIDSNTRNGFFDTGDVSPWSGRPDIGEISPAPQSGDYYGVLSAMRPSGIGTVRAEIWNIFPLSLSSGNQISVSLYARIPGALAFDTLSVRIWDTSFVSYLLTILDSGLLNDTNWTYFNYTVTLPESFNDAGNSRLVIGMSYGSGLPSTSYSGFIDSVSVQQIPEPNTGALMLLSFGFICMKRSYRNAESKQG